MPRQKRFKTNYAGVYYVEGKAVGSNKTERIYYIRYRRDGKVIEEKAGRQYQNDMTPARASGLRSQRIEGKKISNEEKRQKEIAEKLAEQGKWTIQKLWGEYCNHRVDNKSFRTEKGLYRNYLRDVFGKLEPKELIQLNVDRLRIKLLKKKSPQTVKHILAILKRIINFGVDRGLCQGPGFNITLPRVDNIKTEDLNEAQLKKLFEVLNTTTYTTAADMMKLALFTGMRRGEIFKLQWDDVDFDRGFIHIRDPKGGKSQKIPLNDNARQVFKGIHPVSEYVFPARGGGPRKDINKDLREIKEAAGLPKNFRALHGLRHVYATMLASSGQVDMMALQKLLTHKDQRMTQRYIHFRDEALKKASDLAGDILDQAINGEG